jgi:HK97 family phage prohead protease
MDHIVIPFELKSSDSSDGTITGFGSVFGNVNSKGDIVAKGAFKKSIAAVKSGDTAWPAMLLNHGDDTAEGRCPIGIWTRMEETEHGLRLEGKLALKNTRGAEAYALLKMRPRPALNGLSIGYRAKQYDLHGKGDAALRTLKEIQLIEVSLVVFPANRLATVTSVKSEAEPVVDEAALAQRWATGEWEKLQRLAEGR